MKPQRTCDRCYRIKAACTYDAQSETCTRCDRLGHRCERQRAILQPGRPRSLSKSKSKRLSRPSTESPKPVSEDGDLIVTGLPLQLSPLLTRFREHEVSLIEFLLHPAQISGLLHGTTFHKSLRQSMVSNLFFATDQLKDGILALAQSLSIVKNFDFKDPEQVSDSQRGSQALRLFRNSEVKSLDDAHALLWSALALVTYNDISVGSSALPIARSALLQITQWRSLLIGSTIQDTDPSIICLLFVETFECLLSAQIPVFRHEPLPGNVLLDRYYGVCHEILPIFYDICVLYNSIKSGTITEKETVTRIACLAVNIDHWSPELAIMAREHIAMDPADRQHFLLQARSFKFAVQLLLLQAYRSPLSDSLAHAKAGDIEQEIVNALRAGAGRPKYLAFPYFLVCLERPATDGESQALVLRTMNELSNSMAPQSCQTMLSCLKHIWRNKRRNPNLPWFKCISEGQIINMGP